MITDFFYLEKRTVAALPIKSLLEMTSKSSSSSMTGFCLISFNHICMLPSVSSLDGCQELDEVDDIGDTEFDSRSLEVALSQYWLEELVAGKESLG